MKLKIPASTNEGIVNVNVRISGIDKHFAPDGVAYADVRLAGADRLVLLSAKTETSGDASFEHVPFGKYTVTVIPPRELVLTSPATPIEITVEQPRTFVDFQLQTDLGGVTVSGIVKCVDTGKIVPNYPLIMLRSDRDPRYARGAQATSDPTGHFEFHHIREGDYRLGSFPASFNNTGFAPQYASNPAAPDTASQPTFTVTDKDIDNVIYPVVAVRSTRLMGIVTTKDNEPVNGARIRLDNANKQFVTSMDPSSGPDGTFEVVLSLPEGTERLDSLIYAEIPAPPIKVTAKNGHMFDIDDGVTEQGSVPVSFGVGEIVRDIHIVIAAVDRGQVLYGRITTQDG
ncbi:MAG TPA: hypothetical protein PLY86_23070, partial [bacterium]|nr:hypothetical protein [bacterium]